MKKLNVVAKLLTVSTLGFGLIGGMQNAQAGSIVNLVPQKEGEVKTTNLGCLNGVTCITEQELGYKITSLGYSDSQNKQYKPSRLFVDNRTTANDWGFGINFGTTDAGTNPAKDQYWFRPVALDKNGKPVENGQLEVGRFKFDFGKTYSEVTLSLFDVEDTLKTGILEINGISGLSVQQLLASAGLADNGTTKFITLKNVSSFVIQAGYRGSDSVFAKTGDGVAIQATAVPEPGTTASLGALAVIGMLGVRKSKKVNG